MYLVKMLDSKACRIFVGYMRDAYISYLCRFSV